MKTTSPPELLLLETLAAAWSRVERRLDTSLAGVRGISLAEYRLLRALGDSPNAQASLVELAARVGLTPSGVTRALRPMEKQGVVATVRSKRDARLAIAALTPAGREILDDATRLAQDVMSDTLARSDWQTGSRDQLVALLDGLAR